MTFIIQSGHHIIVHMAANVRITGFLSGDAPDGEGRTLANIQQWSDQRLESVHDFIQWMFPLMEPSPVNPGAPVLDEGTIAEIRSRPELQEAVRGSFRRMRRFYEGSRHWISPGNHNHLRITRILKCLRLLGLDAEASEFFAYLKGIYDEEQRKPRPGITARSFEFWRDAAKCD
jgi:hypothetical protein